MIYAAAFDFTSVVIAVLITIALMWGIGKLRDRKRPDYTKASSGKSGKGGGGSSRGTTEKPSRN